MGIKRERKQTEKGREEIQKVENQIRAQQRMKKSSNRWRYRKTDTRWSKWDRKEWETYDDSEI